MNTNTIANESTFAFECGILAFNREERVDPTRLQDYDVDYLRGYFAASRGEVV